MYASKAECVGYPLCHHRLHRRAVGGRFSARQAEAALVCVVSVGSEVADGWGRKRSRLPPHVASRIVGGSFSSRQAEVAVAW